MGAHVNNIISGASDHGSREASGFLDSKGDQRAIENGYYHFTSDRFTDWRRRIR